MQEFLVTEFKVKNYIIKKVDTNFLELFLNFLWPTKELANYTVKYSLM